MAMSLVGAVLIGIDGDVIDEADVARELHEDGLRIHQVRRVHDDLRPAVARRLPSPRADLLLVECREERIDVLLDHGGEDDRLDLEGESVERSRRRALVSLDHLDATAFDLLLGGRGARHEQRTAVDAGRRPGSGTPPRQFGQWW